MVSLAPDGSAVLLSPSDLTAVATCEYGWLRDRVDPQLGRAPRPDRGEDAFLDRVSALGDAHEARTLDRLIAERGEADVVRLSRPEPYTPENIARAREETAQALASGAGVVFQAMLHDGGFGGLADFLVRGADGAYQVVDTKLARHARVTALLQIAAYADLLDGMGVPRARHGSLWLGDGTEHVVDLDEIIPVHRHQRARLERLLAAHVASGQPARWGDDALSVCGACDACAEAVAEHRDVLLTAGATRVQRARLRAAGIATVEQLAASTEAPAGMTERTWRGLRDQAALQLEQPLPDGTPPFRIADPEAVLRLPAPSVGDVFFDFEGDPLWVSPSGAMEGLEYLWGWVEAAEGRTTAATRFREFRFTALWADTRADERAALEAFVAFVEERRRAHPDMRIYHYAPYEVTALKRLVVRHGVGERELDDWLRSGLFVDLYSTVRASLRAGVPSYSIKKLEPLYMGQDRRSEDGVTTAADSVTEYHAYAAAREAEREGRRAAGSAAGKGGEPAPTAAEIRAGIEDYNRYDCVSTARLRDWLLAQVGRSAEYEPVEQPAEEALPDAVPSKAEEDEARERALLALLPQVPDPGTGEPMTAEDLDGDERGLALLTAALGYFARENKPLWWAMFDRAVSAPDEWQEPRANFVFDAVEAVGPWEKPEKGRNLVRRLTVVGRLEPGTEIRVRTKDRDQFKLKALYDQPPAWAELAPNAVRWQSRSPVNVTSVEELAEGRFRVRLAQRQSVKYEPQAHDETPMAVFHLNDVPPGALLDRIREAADDAIARRALPEGAVSDILARRAPRTTGRPLEEIAADVRQGRIEGADGLVEALRSADGSYVAVQGPPGTGKTHVGSHAVKALLEQGWTVGVTAQSHAVVENFLDKLVSIGVDPDHVGKEPGDPEADHPWTELDGTDVVHSFLQPGRVLGGTSWTFANGAAQPVDLLVVDEAGQLSLAYLLGAAARARTILLLGDPQQLPQVLRGEHPQPIGEAALTWIADGAPVLPAERGLFLDTSWRMHSALTEAVSTLSYAGELGAKEDATDARRLEGVEPGLHPVAVEHAGNAVSSPEEAQAVVEIIRSLLGRTWQERPDAPGRPLEASDVIVVAPYNAQVATVEAALEAAGLGEATVGTVDRFQGREAAVAILTMAASAPQDVPRGLDFLLNRNRLNVSISRGQWACYLVHSPALADALPVSPQDLPMIGAFLRLIHREDAA